VAVAQLSITFFLQMAVILATCRIVGWLGRKYLKQPQVVCEMIAGVLLGPSLFGLLAPDVQRFVFRPENQGVLYVGAQFGVGLYMFLVGLGFRTDDFKANVHRAASVSIAGMVIPFAMAVVATPWLMSVPSLFAPTATRFDATLFFGAAIAITAFPMLARIIHERGLTGTSLGTLSLAAGAIDDAAAWCVLAVVLGSFGAAGSGVAYTAIIGGFVFAAFMIFAIPRILAPLARSVEREAAAGKSVSNTVFAVVVTLFMLSAYTADRIGLHAVLGGFLLGCVMPRGVLADTLRKQLEPFTVIVLLPMFFTYSGLNTELTLVASPYLFTIALAVLAMSVLAKFGACWAAARLAGQDNRTALGIGALMNARGLMELIIINIGLQAGVIGPALFSMLVLMAMVTTLMASPVFEVVYGRQARKSGELGAVESAG
jgi:K+:H+ antiporter